MGGTTPRASANADRDADTGFIPYFSVFGAASSMSYLPTENGKDDSTVTRKAQTSPSDSPRKDGLGISGAAMTLHAAQKFQAGSKSLGATDSEASNPNTNPARPSFVERVSNAFTNQPPREI